MIIVNPIIKFHMAKKVKTYTWLAFGLAIIIAAFVEGC